MLKKFASGVLGLRAHKLVALCAVRAQSPPRTHPYASVFLLPAALLDESF